MERPSTLECLQRPIYRRYPQSAKQSNVNILKFVFLFSFKSFAIHLQNSPFKLESEPCGLLSHSHKAGERNRLAVHQEQITIALIVIFDKGLNIQMNGLPAAVP